MSVSGIHSIEIQRVRRIIREPDDFGDAVSGMHLTVDFQKRQERVSLVEQFQTAGWALDFGQANVRTRVRGVLRGGWGSFCLSRGPGAAVWNGQSAGPGSASLLPPGGVVDGFTTPEYAWLTAAIPPEMWNDSLAIAGLDGGSVPQLTVCSLPPPVFATLDRRLRGFQQCMTRAAVCPAPERELLLREATAFISECFTTLAELTAGSPPPPASLRNRARLVRLAETWMQDHLGETVRMPDACLALGISRRELEYAFRSILNQSPRDFFQTLRLHAIRRALLRADSGHGSIIQIAYAHGVTHLGRFAASYRELFGENPGVTLGGGKSPLGKTPHR